MAFNPDTNRSANLPPGASMAVANGVKSAPYTPHPSFESAESGDSFADPSRLQPLVPVAAAPKQNNLYESLIRYHNENDSDSEDGYGARRRRKNAPGLKSSNSDLEGDSQKPAASTSLNEDNDEDDRKLPAKPTSQLKAPPPTPANNLKPPPPPPPTPPSASSLKKTPPKSPLAKRIPTPNRVEYPTSPVATNGKQTTNADPTAATQPTMGSFYAAALESQRLQQENKIKSPKPAVKPGIVHVHEPAIRPDSAMYRAAYGETTTRQEVAAPSAFPEPMGIRDVRDALSAIKVSKQESKRQLQKESEERFDRAKRSLGNHGRSKSPYAGLHGNHSANQMLSQSSHVPRSNFGQVKPSDGRMSNNMVRTPSGNRLSSLPAPSVPGASVGAPQHMVNTGNEGFLGFPSDGSNDANLRRSFQQPPRHNSADTPRRPSGVSMSSAYGGSRPTPAPSYPRVANDDPMRASAHSAMTPRDFPDQRGNPSYSGMGYSNRDLSSPAAPPSRGFEPKASTVSTESMDEELRLALEISKQDTGSTLPGPPISRNQPMRSNPTIVPIPTSRTAAPRHLPTRPTTTNIEHQTSFGREALAHAETQSSLSDLMLALKLSAEESQEPRRSTTNLDELLAFEMSQENHRSMTDFVAAGISTSSSNDNGSKPDEQRRILEKIREEQEQKELEMALQASKAESKSQEFTVPSNMETSQDFLLSQQKAMEEYSRTTQERDIGRRQNSMGSFDSEGRRRELLQRGTSETREAIQTGNAHVVTCRGCGGKLQAPVSYSLVFCPKCQTISPA